MEKINWFPGHMAKAIADLQSKKKNFDMLIEIVDARCPHISSNRELLGSFKLPVLTVAVKQDLAVIDNNFLNISTNNKKTRSIIINKIKQELKSKIDKCRSKGLLNPQFNILVLGLPNIGKSSFINLLLNKNNLLVQNYPGVTRKQTLVKIDNMIFLNDSPGILFKNIDNNTTGYILSLIGCIKKEVIPMYEVIKFGYEFYCKKYPNQIKQKFGLNEFGNFEQFLELVCKKYQYILDGNKLDKQRALEYLYSMFMNGKICKINYEN